MKYVAQYVFYHNKKDGYTKEAYIINEIEQWGDVKKLKPIDFVKVNHSEDYGSVVAKYNVEDIVFTKSGRVEGRIPLSHSEWKRLEKLFSKNE